MLIGWFYKCLIVLALHTTVGTCGSVPAVFTNKVFLNQKMCSNWSQSMSQISWTPTRKASAHRSVPSGLRAARAGRRENKLSWSEECLKGPVQIRVMREQLLSTESREHGAKDLCIQSLALSGSCSLPLLTDAVCLSLCLVFPQKTNAGNHCALSPAAPRLQHVTLF